MPTYTDSIRYGNAYLDGANISFEVNDFQLPEFVRTLISHPSGGASNYPAFGMIEDMQATLNVTAWNAKFIKLISTSEKTPEFTFDWVVETPGTVAGSKTVDVVIQGHQSRIPFPLLTMGNNEVRNLPIVFAVTLLKVTLTGGSTPILDIDLEKNVYKMNGQDMYPGLETGG